MRRNCASVVGLLLVLTAPARADLRFDDTRIDAGQVRAGFPLQKTFAFANAGGDTVHITSVRASCGCAAPQLERRTLAPGERGSVRVSVNSLGQPEGPHLWTIHVTYQEAGNTREAALELAAHIVTEVSVRPAVLTLFAGQKLTHDIVVRDRRAQPMRIREVRASSPHVRPQLGDAQVDAAGLRAWKIALELSDDFPAGRHEEVVSIYTDDADYAELRVRVTVVKREPRDVSLHPRDARFEAGRTGAIPSRIVLVRSSDDRAVSIDDVVADHPAVTCKWAMGPGKHATVKFTIDRDRLEGKTLHTTARIVVAAPVREILDVPISCEVRP